MIHSDGIQRGGRSNHLLLAKLLTALTILLVMSCDSNRIFENNREFTDRKWMTTDTVQFEFSIPDTTRTYSLYCNIRNTIDYPYSRIFVMSQLNDSLQDEIADRLLNINLFDKTGRPTGESGLGDIYDHRFPFLEHLKFHQAGNHTASFVQFMRQDTLPGVLALGLRVETDHP